MTLASDDPTYWPSINSYRINSYSVGSWSGLRLSLPLTSWSDLDCVLTVTATIVVTYDWGERDNIKESLKFYKYFQHLHSDKRYWSCYDRSSHLAKDDFRSNWYGWAEFYTRGINLTCNRGNVGHLWPFCIWVYVACITAVIYNSCWLLKISQVRYLGMLYVMYVRKSRQCCCTDEPYLTISLHILSVFSHTHNLCLFWLAKYRQYSDNLIDRYSVSFALITALPSN
jgi:hypothetical protein